MSASAATAEEFQFTTKKEETDTIIRHNLYWAMGASIVPIPLFDMAAITGIQLKMLNEFSKLYDIPFSKNAGKSIIASLIGSIGPVGMAQGGVGILVKFVPGIGQYVSYATLPVWPEHSPMRLARFLCSTLRQAGPSWISTRLR